MNRRIHTGIELVFYALLVWWFGWKVGLVVFLGHWILNLTFIQYRGK
jgi:hypothetical protein